MQYPKIIVALCFASCVSGALAQTKEKTAQYNALGAAGARAVRDGLNDPDSFRVTAAWIQEAQVPEWKDPTAVWVCFTGRTKNKMGGYIKIVAEAVGDPYNGTAVNGGSAPSDGDTADDRRGTVMINDSCETHHRLADVTDAAKAALKADLDKQ
jgi:hypothetical protein